MSTIRDHAATCAALHLCTTPTYAAAALNCPRDEAAAALRNAVFAGLFRRLLLPGLGNTSCYQPTARAGGVDARHAPKFLRTGVSAAACWRGLLRGAVAFVAAPELTFLTHDALALLCEQYAIPTAGHAAPLAALDDAGSRRVFVPVPPPLAARAPHGVIASAAARWLPLLETGAAKLHFVTPAGRSADSLRAAHAELTPAAESDAARELDAIDARIAADPTGVARIQLVRQRAELSAAVAAAPVAAFPWLAREVVEMRL